MLFVRLVCQPSTAALVVSRVLIGQINTSAPLRGLPSPYGAFRDQGPSAGLAGRRNHSFVTNVITQHS